MGSQLEVVMKKSALLFAAILGLGVTATASAGDDRVIGAVLGGVAGGAIGGNIGGRDGAALGVVVGAALGAAVADDGRRHYGSSHGYYDHRGHDRYRGHYHGGDRIVYRPVYRPAPPVRHVYHYQAPRRHYSHDRDYRRDHRDHRDYRHDRGRNDRGHRGHDRGRH